MKHWSIQNLLGNRGVFLMVFGGVTTALVGLSFWVISFVSWQVAVEEELDVTDELSPIYVDYYFDVETVVSPEAYLAMAEYQREFPMPQNVQVLQGEPTVEIIGYMLNHFSGGMGVGCVYCHSLANFAADEWDDEVAMQNKMTARAHLWMVQDLNRGWLAQLPSLSEQKQPSGAQITCATCHNGQAQPVAWVPGQSNLPDDLRLPLDEPLSVTDEDVLNVNARTDISLDTVQYNQNIMYHMNVSMNVGCTHCHNSRYFPSWEVPAKYYALNMLQMAQFIHAEYSEVWGGQEPSCSICHQGAVIPPGAARSVDVMPAALVPEPDRQTASR